MHIRLGTGARHANNTEIERLKFPYGFVQSRGLLGGTLMGICDRKHDFLSRLQSRDDLRQQRKSRNKFLAWFRPAINVDNENKQQPYGVYFKRFLLSKLHSAYADQKYEDQRDVGAAECLARGVHRSVRRTGRSRQVSPRSSGGSRSNLRWVSTRAPESIKVSRSRWAASQTSKKNVMNSAVFRVKYNFSSFWMDFWALKNCWKQP